MSGWQHGLILAGIPLCAAALAWIARKKPATSRSIRLALGWGILANESMWYWYCLHQGLVHFPYGLPLELCDLTLWLAVASLLTLNSSVFEVAYYWALAGSTMALLTPDLGAALPSYPAIEFFASHGGVVAGILFLVWGGILRPRPGSWRRAFILLNVYAATLGLFNKIFNTNYGYLCLKPAHPSLLDVFGRWPWYLVWSDLLALALFILLWLPFNL
jgi:hypothetical integral membrane protein (TIGR02206 family)